MELKGNIKEIIDNAIFSPDEIKNIINNKIDSIVDKINYTIQNMESLENKQLVTVYVHRETKNVVSSKRENSYLTISIYSNQRFNGFHCKENIFMRIRDTSTVELYKSFLDVKYVENSSLYLEGYIDKSLRINIKIFDDTHLLALLFSKYPRLFPNAPEIDEALQEYRFSDDYGMDYINTMIYKDQIIEFLSILEDFLTDIKKFRKCSEYEMRDRDEKWQGIGGI